LSDEGGPKWLQATLAVTAGQAQQVETALTLAGALAVTLGDAGDRPVLEPVRGETPLWPETTVTGLFDGLAIDTAALTHSLVKALGPLAENLRLEPLEQRDWVQAWTEHYQAMRFGRNLWICPHHQSVPDPDAVIVRLDPGLAFGTGTHPTTALCLQWLDARPPTGIVLDYGCGSGILAVAAALLGAEQVLAVDIDPQALAATRENARRNAVGDKIHVSTPQACPSGTAHTALANILAGPLITLAPLLAARVQCGGTLILSGLLERHAQPVLAAYCPWFESAGEESLDGWLRLDLLRRARGSDLQANLM
jgi:ribosomal protein L11 methyltransferase